MTTIRFHHDQTVQAVLNAWPATKDVFIRRRMACVGCVLAPFMTIAEAAIAYGIEPDTLEAELRAAASTHPPESTFATAAIHKPESRQ
jgi:hybrid cluster-associated redox disulfide protein